MAWTIDTAHTSVQFSTRHMAIATVHGRFDSFRASMEVEDGRPTSVEAVIDVDSINTREPQRDGHLKSGDFFDAETFPHITFTSTKITVEDGRMVIEGNLTIRDVTKAVKLEGEVTPVIKDYMGHDRLGFTAQGKIDRTEWGLTWNQVLDAGRLLVGHMVTITIEGEAVAA